MIINQAGAPLQAACQVSLYKLQLQTAASLSCTSILGGKTNTKTRQFTLNHVRIKCTVI